MPRKPPKTLEDFADQYTPEIISYINFQNSKSSVQVIPKDFLQDFFTKVLTEKTLEKFDPSRGQFNTFLNRVLYNFYVSMVERRAKEEKFFADPPGDKSWGDDDTIPSRAIDNYLNFETEENIHLVLSFMQKIPNIKERLLIKLKFYYPSMAFSDDGISYLSKSLNIREENVTKKLNELYEDKPGESIGIRNKDISKMRIKMFSYHSIPIHLSNLEKRDYKLQ